MIETSKVGGTSTTVVKKKFLKGEYHLVFVFINKVLLLGLKKRIIASSVDLFLIKSLRKFGLMSSYSIDRAYA